MTLAPESAVEQFSVTGWFDTEAEARISSHLMAVRLTADLRRRGYTAFEPAPISSHEAALLGIDPEVFADCRILRGWVAPGFGNPDAKDWTVRIDVLARKEKR